MTEEESDPSASAPSNENPSEWSPGITYEEAKSLMSSKDSSPAGFSFHQTRYRIKDPKKSLKFYNQVLGMSLLNKMDSARMNFSLYFLGYENANETFTTGSDNVTKSMNLNNQGALELMHDWSYDRYKYYRTTSIEMRYYADPRDLPHITIIVPSLADACERFNRYKVPFVGDRNASMSLGIVFIKDPDAYAIEIVEKSFL